MCYTIVLIRNPQSHGPVLKQGPTMQVAVVGMHPAI